MSNPNDETPHEDPNAIKIRPRQLAKKKRSRKKAKSATTNDKAQSESPKVFESNIDRAKFLLTKKPKSKAFYKKDTSEKDVSPEKVEEEKEPQEEAVSVSNSERPSGRQKRKRSFKRYILNRFLLPLRGRQISFVPMALISFFAVVLFSWFFHWLGYASGVQDVKNHVAKANVELPTAVADDLDKALEELRQGNAKKAMNGIMAIERSNPWYSSLSYLSAMAAMESGDMTLAEKMANESIEKQERVSDSLGIKAVIETDRVSDPLKLNIVDPKMNAESLLRQAIIADAANPYPHFELANLLRYKNKKEEAIREIHAALVRLNPVDSHLVMGITLALMNTEDMPVEQLPVLSSKTEDPAKLFPAALAAMRVGKFEQAAEYLHICKGSMDGVLFDYLVNDPALRRYMREPQLAKFYSN